LIARRAFASTIVPSTECARMANVSASWAGTARTVQRVCAPTPAVTMVFANQPWGACATRGGAVQIARRCSALRTAQATVCAATVPVVASPTGQVSTVRKKCVPTDALATASVTQTQATVSALVSGEAKTVPFTALTATASVLANVLMRVLTHVPTRSQETDPMWVKHATSTAPTLASSTAQGETMWSWRASRPRTLLR